MPLSFVPKGPVYIQEGTEIHFKRASQIELNKFNYENNPFKDRDEKEYKEILKQIIAGNIDEIEFTHEETQVSISQMPKFCLEFVTDVKNLIVDGEQIEWSSLGDDMKYIFFDELYQESEDFRDFVSAVKNGAKKKFAEVDKD